MLVRTQFACDAANEHLENAVDAQNAPLVKSYLATYCAFLFCSEMEEHLEKILQRRLSQVVVGRISQFILNTNKGMIKRTNKSDIAKFLANFGDEAKDEFNQAIEDKEVQTYMNVVTARHSKAHKTDPVEVTLDEIRDAIAVANRILTEVESVIGR